VIVLDANLLLYAYETTAIQHTKARRWFEGIVSSGAPVGLPWQSVAVFSPDNEKSETPPRTDVPLTSLNIADSTYFNAMHMRLLAGRGFTDADSVGGSPVAVITEEILRKWWTAPHLALGNQIKLGGPYMEGPTYQIVGVVANVSQMGFPALPWARWVAGAHHDGSKEWSSAFRPKIPE
jgi:hypothetical protein